MNKILLGLVVIGSVVALTAGTAGALFTSTASNNGNTFGAGTLTLTINGAPDATSTPVFSVANAAPGYSETQTLALENTGTIDATTLVMTSIDVTDTGAGAANLGDVLNVLIWEDLNNDQIVDPGETVWVNNVAMTSVPADVNLGPIAAGELRNLAVTVTFDAGAGNEYQGESVLFDFNFQANQ